MPIRLRSISVPNEETFNQLTYDAFWNEYINRNNPENDTLFEEAIKHHLSNSDNREFFERTTALFEEWDVHDVAAVAELLSKVNDGLMLPVVKQLAYTVERRRGSFTPLANREYLKIVVSCIAKYIENHGEQQYAVQMGLPMPYPNLRTVIRVTIFIIQHSLTEHFFVNLHPIDRLTRSQDTLKQFMVLAKDVIHPCVVAEIALKFVRSTSLEDNEIGKVKGIIKALLETLKASSAQWYNSVCSDRRYINFIENHLGLPSHTESSNPQVLSDHDRNALIDCINRGNGVEREFQVLPYSGEPVRGFRYRNGELPPYGDITDDWFINAGNTSKHVSLIVDSKDEILKAIGHRNEQLVSLCCVPAPTTN